MRLTNEQVGVLLALSIIYACPNPVLLVLGFGQVGEHKDYISVLFFLFYVIMILFFFFIYMYVSNYVPNTMQCMYNVLTLVQ